jgi:hypothetical protein
MHRGRTSRYRTKRILSQKINHLFDDRYEILNTFEQDGRSTPDRNNVRKTSMKVIWICDKAFLTSFNQKNKTFNKLYARSIFFYHSRRLKELYLR